MIYREIEYRAAPKQLVLYTYASSACRSKPVIFLVSTQTQVVVLFEYRVTHYARRVRLNYAETFAEQLKRSQISYVCGRRSSVQDEGACANPVRLVDKTPYRFVYR